MISCENISKEFYRGSEKIRIIDSLSFSVGLGEFVSIFGPNGCGKSTLMNILVGLDKPTSGKIVGLERTSQQVGFVFQDYRRTLLPWLSARDNILFPLKLRGLKKQEKAQRLNALLELARLDFALDRPVFSLSGGQAQMIALLRALIIGPKLLILDEPFSALDYSRTLEMRTKLSQIARALNLSVLMISHDLEEALFLGDHLVMLSPPPTRIIDIVKIPFPKMRSPSLLADSDFLKIKAQAFRVFLNCIGYHAEDDLLVSEEWQRAG